MPEHDYDPLMRQLKAAEVPLADDGFSQQVLARLATEPARLPLTVVSAHPHGHRWILLLALVAGALVALFGLSTLSIESLLLTGGEEVLSFAGFTLTSFGLWLLAGWALTLTGCTWTLALAR